MQRRQRHILCPWVRVIQCEAMVKSSYRLVFVNRLLNDRQRGGHPQKQKRRGHLESGKEDKCMALENMLTG